ncbi:MAG TPA: outer membrane beta-barrel family protein, partial [Flavitalea sp.]|nr:outer membrane beta-barrel family protein [Flavitalea sp.]
MKRSAFFLLLLFAALTAFSQETGIYKGRIMAGNSPHSGATIALLKKGDSALVKLSVSDNEGLFEIPGIIKNEYLLLVTSVGYDSVLLVAKEGISNDIKLNANAQSLGSVTVVAKRPLVETRLDKTIVNVDASPSNAGATALELLEKSPGISVDKDGNISLKGKQGVIVLMDGKQTYLSGQDLANMLRSMPASQLDQVEIMTQPSAKFDAAGNSGILNLKTKKAKTMGFNGSVNVGYIQGNYPKSPNSFNFNYRKGKINLFTNGGYTYWQSNSEQTLNRKFKLPSEDYVFDQVGNSINSSSSVNARVGLDYNVDEKTTLGILVGGNYSLRKYSNISLGDFFLENTTQVDSSIFAANTTRNPWKNFTANANFKKTLNKNGREITADIDYIKYSSELNQYTDNRVLYPAKPTSIYLLRAVLPSDIDIYSGKVDYVHPLNKETKIEAGAKISYVSTDNNAPYETFNPVTGKWIDDVRKDHFRYDEQITAGYLNFSKQVKKWGFQTGLRGEHTHSKGTQVLIGKSISRDYFQVFPTAYISYAMNDQNQFGLNYGRRVERPNYQDLNPFQQFLDLYTFNKGNPYLTPQFTNNIELSHIFKSKLSTTLNYSYTSDIINDILVQNDETKVTYQTKENVASRRTVGLAVSYNAQLTTWWTTSLYGNVNNNYYKGLVNNIFLSTDITSFSANFNQQFKFAKTWGAEMSGFYQSKSLVTSMFIIDPMYVISFGFSKQIMKTKGMLKLSVIDPFRLQKVDVHINHSNIDMIVTNRWDNRRVGLTFTYRFSKGQNVQQRKRTSSSQEEQNR